MAGQAEDYQRGEMDIHEQSSTYVGFLGWSKWGSLILAVGLVFFTLLFCTKAGFIGAAVSAGVMLVLGVVAFTAKPGGSH